MIMTSFGAAALLQHRLRAVTLDSYSLRLFACLLSCLLACWPAACRRRSDDTSLLELGFGRSQDSLPTPTSLPVAVSRRSPSRHASRRITYHIQSVLILASFPRFDSDTSWAQIYLAASVTAARSAVLLHFCKCILAYDVPTSGNASPFEVLSTMTVFNFLFILCH
jgi:hypothetical protein